MKRMFRITAVMIVSVLFISFNALAQNSNNSTNKNKREFPDVSANKNKLEFPQLAYSGGMMEVRLGKLAQQKASAYKVKEFGERMIHDHSMANDELKNIAKKNNIMLPDNMLPANQNTYNELSKFSGPDFDLNYMNTMVKDHKEDIKAFENASANAGNMEIRHWAQKTLPILKQHLKLAETTLSDLNKSK